eukprot:GDKI01042847.1.p1 GENE.GDKI01042847.1~~GDKI01042847.1.p1  ORF type:complete len:186 (-),score=22.62 GDKI01042847.1:110-622(-)
MLSRNIQVIGRPASWRHQIAKRFSNGVSQPKIEPNIHTHTTPTHTPSSSTLSTQSIAETTSKTAETLTVAALDQQHLAWSRDGLIATGGAALCFSLSPRDWRSDLAGLAMLVLGGQYMLCGAVKAMHMCVRGGVRVGDRQTDGRCVWCGDNPLMVCVCGGDRGQFAGRNA